MNLSCIDFDSFQNIWAGGNNENIYCITPSKKITSFSFKNNINRLRVNNGYLYAAINGADSIDAVWRFKIFSSDSLGSPELFFRLSALTSAKPAKIFDFIFDRDNNLIICSNMPDVVNIVYQDKSVKSIMQNYLIPFNISNLQNANFTFGSKSKNDLYFTVNNGPDSQTYQTYSDIYKLSVHPLVDYPGWFIGNNGKIISKLKNDTVWNEQYTNTSINLNSIYFADDSTGIAVGDSGIILTTTNGGIKTKIDYEYSNNQIISGFKLHQNYPNPFNPTTTIKYELPKESYVKVCIYNLLGEVVSTLVDGNQNAGYYTANWNATNFASGIYFYTIYSKPLEGSKDFRAVKKMILLK